MGAFLAFSHFSWLEFLVMEFEPGVNHVTTSRGSCGSGQVRRVRKPTLVTTGCKSLALLQLVVLHLCVSMTPW